MGPPPRHLAQLAPQGSLLAREVRPGAGDLRRDRGTPRPPGRSAHQRGRSGPRSVGARHHGPIFRQRERGGRAEELVLDWGFNAWGGKYPPCDNDDAIPTRIAEEIGLPVVSPGMVLEGGSIEVNGAGTLLTTEQCLLNPNRNPRLSKAGIEGRLRDFLGIRKILWLGDGIEGDDTDGHVDDLTRFVDKGTVVTAVEEDPRDANHTPLRDNLARLRGISLLPMMRFRLAQ